MIFGNGDIEIETAFTELYLCLVELSFSFGDEKLVFYFQNEIIKLHRLFIEFAKADKDEGDPRASARVTLHVNNLLNFLSIFISLKKSAIIPALKAEKKLLIFKIKLLDAQYNKFKIEPEVKKEIISDAEKIAERINISKMETIINEKVNYQQKILDFMKDKEYFSTFEFYNHLSSLKQRTVRRYLDEMVKSGLIIKELRGKSIYYRKKTT